MGVVRVRCTFPYKVGHFFSTAGPLRADLVKFTVVSRGRGQGGSWPVSRPRAPLPSLDAPWVRDRACLSPLPPSHAAAARYQSPTPGPANWRIPARSLAVGFRARGLSRLSGGALALDGPDVGPHPVYTGPRPVRSLTILAPVARPPFPGPVKDGRAAGASVKPSYCAAPLQVYRS